MTDAVRSRHAEDVDPLAPSDVRVLFDMRTGQYAHLRKQANNTKRWNKTMWRMEKDREWNLAVAIATRRALGLPLSKALRKTERTLDK